MTQLPVLNEINHDKPQLYMAYPTFKWNFGLTHSRTLTLGQYRLTSRSCARRAGHAGNGGLAEDTVAEGLGVGVAEGHHI